MAPGDGCEDEGEDEPAGAGVDEAAGAGVDDCTIGAGPPALPFGPEPTVAPPTASCEPEYGQSDDN